MRFKNALYFNKLNNVFNIENRFFIVFIYDLLINLSIIIYYKGNIKK